MRQREGGHDSRTNGRNSQNSQRRRGTGLDQRSRNNLAQQAPSTLDNCPPPGYRGGPIGAAVPYTRFPPDAGDREALQAAQPSEQGPGSPSHNASFQPRGPRTSDLQVQTSHNS